MLTHVKRLAQKSKTALISYHIYDNWRVKRRFSAGNIALTSGSTHAALDLDASLAYIDTVFDDYFSASGLPVSALAGKRILELGPGDNVGVALKFLLAGAEQVICLDRFYSQHDGEQQRRIYAAMRERLAPHEQALFDRVIDLETGLARCQRGSQVEEAPSSPVGYPGGSPDDSGTLTYWYGTAIEEAAQHFPPASFDWIISRAVLEHVYDPDSAFNSMHSLLKPGGYMLHKVDFRDHGMFSQYGHHPLTFLTIPEQMYRRMVYDSGKPNRKLINYYEQQATKLGLSTTILITHLVGAEREIEPPAANVVAALAAARLSRNTVVFGVGCNDSSRSLLKHIRPHLQQEFKQLTDEQLMVSGIFLVAQKPGSLRGATADVSDEARAALHAHNDTSEELPGLQASGPYHH